MLHFTERQIRSLQVSGKHYLEPLRELRLEWSGSSSSSTQDEPDLRYFSDNFTIRDGDTLYSIKPSSYPDPTRYFRNLDETSREANPRLRLPFKQWGGLAGEIKAGAFAQEKSPRLQRDPVPLPAAELASLPGRRERVLHRHQRGHHRHHRSPAALRQLHRRRHPALEHLRRRPADPSPATEWSELPLNRQLRLITGARFETTRIDVASANPELPAGELETNDLLPSVNLVYQVGEANTRLSYGRTLARPTFRELAPFSSFAFVGDFTTTTCAGSGFPTPARSTR